MSRPEQEIRDYFAPLFAPATIAVVGASTAGNGRGNVFIDQLRKFGYGGEIYPIHPKAAEIDGLKAYPALGATPKSVDYAYVAIPGPSVPAAIAAAAGRVRFAHILSSGFAEVPAGRALQEELLRAARGAGVRLLGPNCNGAFSPRGRLTFIYRGATDPGAVGIVSQSGGLGVDIIRRGQERGLRFTGVMTVGNSADLGPVDLLEFYLADPETRVIGMYLEGIAGGRRLFDLLRWARGRKPVVILKGGRTIQGTQAVVSHTGALAGDERVWTALSRQTGVVLVKDLEELIDAILALQTLTARADRPTRKVALFGNGGGTSVLAVDAFAERGLDVVPFRPKTRAALEALDLPPGTSVANPIDAPVGTLRQEDGRIAEKIMDIVYGMDDQDAFLMHLNLPVLLDHIRTGSSVAANLLDAAERVRQRNPDKAQFVLVLRSDGSPEIDARKREYREQARLRGIPVYDEMSGAAIGLAALRSHAEFLRRIAAD
ncbi:MAG: acyl-CoA synthetase [Alphaproteobacteria bacterium]|nr:acyl-CoA synthetase [Alphaproteobacteria bacterium]